MESRVWLSARKFRIGWQDMYIGVAANYTCVQSRNAGKKRSWRHITHMTIMCMWLKVTRSAQNMGKSKAGLGKITRFNTWVEHIRLTRTIIRSCRLTLWWVLLYRFKILETKETIHKRRNSKDHLKKLWITWLHRAWNHICRLDKNFAKLLSRRLWRSLSRRVLQKHFWRRSWPWEEYQELQEHCNHLDKISSIDHCCAKVANLVRLICCTSCCDWLLPPLAHKLPELILHKATSEQGSQWCVLSNPTAGLPKKTYRQDNNRLSVDRVQYPKRSNADPAASHAVHLLWLYLDGVGCQRHALAHLLHCVFHERREHTGVVI